MSSSEALELEGYFEHQGFDDMVAQWGCAAMCALVAMEFALPSDFGVSPTCLRARGKASAHNCKTYQHEWKRCPIAALSNATWSDPHRCIK